MNRKPVALWAVPRSVSTAFERTFVERDDFEVLHEPFSAAYYFGEERRSDRFAGEEPEDRCRPTEILDDVLAPRERPVFFKDMAYHVAGFMDRDFADRFVNTFLIRHPEQVLVSLHKMWPDFTFEEAGYEQLHRLHEYARKAGQEPVVVDAADLTANPEGTIAAYCEAVGVPFKPEALSWKPRKVPEWETWDEWHTEAQESTGIGEVPEKQEPLPEKLSEVYERCRPFYEELRERILRPV